MLTTYHDTMASKYPKQNTEKDKQAVEIMDKSIKIELNQTGCSTKPLSLTQFNGQPFNFVLALNSFNELENQLSWL